MVATDVPRRTAPRASLSAQETIAASTEPTGSGVGRPVSWSRASSTSSCAWRAPTRPPNADAREGARLEGRDVPLDLAADLGRFGPERLTGPAPPRQPLIGLGGRGVDRHPDELAVAVDLAHLGEDRVFEFALGQARLVAGRWSAPGSARTGVVGVARPRPGRGRWPRPSDGRTDRRAGTGCSRAGSRSGSSAAGAGSRPARRGSPARRRTGRARRAAPGRRTARRRGSSPRRCRPGCAGSRGRSSLDQARPRASGGPPRRATRRSPGHPRASRRSGGRSRRRSGPWRGRAGVIDVPRGFRYPNGGVPPSTRRGQPCAPCRR